MKLFLNLFRKNWNPYKIGNIPKYEKIGYYFLAFVASVCISAIVWAINMYA
jgi:hypothetical protein